MLIEKPTRLRDPAYRKSAQGRPCMVEGCHDTETVVLCHIRMPENSGTGLKPPDDESLFLCHRHHDELDYRRTFVGSQFMTAAEWIVRNIVLPQRRAAYADWKAEK